MEFTNLNNIILELQKYAKKVHQEDIDKVVDLILSAKKIFVIGAGRSGFVARGFANRLLHLGFNVHFVGEPTTPPVGKDDLLIIGSGSGTTASLVTMAQKAKKLQTKIATITISPQNTIGSMADAIITLPGTSKEDKNLSSIQPVGSMFEQLSWLVYDGMIMTLKERTNQTNEDLLIRHANLE